MSEANYKWTNCNTFTYVQDYRDLPNHCVNYLAISIEEVGSKILKQTCSLSCRFWNARDIFTSTDRRIQMRVNDQRSNLAAGLKYGYRNLSFLLQSQQPREIISSRCHYVDNVELNSFSRSTWMQQTLCCATSTVAHYLVWCLHDEL